MYQNILQVSFENSLAILTTTNVLKSIQYGKEIKI